MEFHNSIEFFFFLNMVKVYCQKVLTSIC